MKLKEKGGKFVDNIVKKVVVYPFYDEFIPVVKFLNKMNSEFIVHKVVAPMGFGLEGKDAGEAYKKNPIGIKVTSDFDEAISDSDILFVTSGYKCTSIYKHIIKQIEKAISMKKDIICTIELSSKQLNEFIDLSNKQNVKFTYYNKYENKKEDIADISVQKMKEIHVPVICIGEMLEGFQGFELLLRTTLYLKEQGYNVLSVAKPKYSSVFNIKSMPEFIYETGMTDENKIYNFNAYIHELEEKQKPDVIVIQMPDSMLKYNDTITNQFGIYSYIVSQAVKSDYFIYCYQHDDLGSEMIRMLSETFKYRFGFEISAVSIVNKCLLTLDKIESDNNLPLLWFEQLTLDESIQKNYFDSSIPVYNCEDDNQSIKLFENMINTLTNYGEVSKFI